MTKTIKIIAGVSLAAALTVGVGFAFTPSTKTDTVTTVTVAPPVVVSSNLTLAGETTIKIRNIEVDDSNLVRLESTISAQSVAKTINALEKARRSGETEVYLLLDSPGGSVVDGNKLVGYIKASPIAINTVCVGVCASMAAHIHQAGKKRMMGLKAILMFHPASGGAQGTVEGMMSQISMFKRLMERMDAEVAARAGIKYEVFKAKVLEEYWIETQDALANKLADEAVNLLTFEPVPVSMGIFGGDGDQQAHPETGTKRKYELTL